MLVSADPVDETFYAATGTHGPRCLRLRLVARRAARFRSTGTARWCSARWPRRRSFHVRSRCWRAARRSLAGTRGLRLGRPPRPARDVFVPSAGDDQESALDAERRYGGAGPGLGGARRRVRAASHLPAAPFRAKCTSRTRPARSASSSARASAGGTPSPISSSVSPCTVARWADRVVPFLPDDPVPRPGQHDAVYRRPRRRHGACS